MPLNLASPGIVVREVDLTIGRVDPTSGSTGALVGPFERGPVGDPQLIESEEDLLQTFGKPYSIDKHYENWLVASSYLAYGGTMQIVRSDQTGLRNSINSDATSAKGIKIKSSDHYQELNYDETPITGVTFAANTPGTWGNSLRVATIDARADQILTGVSTVNAQGGTLVGHAVKIAVPAGTVDYGTGVSAGTTSVLDGHFTGVISEIVGVGSFAVKLVNHVASNGTITPRDYQQNGVIAFPQPTGSPIAVAIHTAGQATAAINETYSGEYDWFESQKIKLNVGEYDWSQLADKPGTSSFAAGRGGRFDEIHVVVFDDTGDITGNAGTILEKHTALSKASDAEYSVGSSSFWRKYLETNSRYVFGGQGPTGSGLETVSFTDNGASVFEADTDTGWNQPAQGVNFASSGNVGYAFTGGALYGGTTANGGRGTEDNASTGIKAVETSGAFTSDVGDIVGGYTLFENAEETDIDFVLMGSASFTNKFHSIQLAQKVIGVAESRQDCVAFVSPYRQAFLNETSDGTMQTVNDIDKITENIVSYYSPVTSSSYGVLDSGYKYMYDRFNNTFRYVPLNGDIAGTCARTSLEQFPWFSPAGTSRGAILNAVKLVYNPGKKQRDILYSNRINPVINSPGAGIILFGDKTAFAKASAFDRINVRRLFIYLEDAISAAAKDQLFEFNDELTRTNFVNIVEPFLRDVQSKRGIFDFVVVCDETNNTAAVIDSNEFVADIFIKPARSINFIGLTFVATRTGVSFEEVIGSV